MIYPRSRRRTPPQKQTMSLRPRLLPTQKKQWMLQGTSSTPSNKCANRKRAREEPENNDHYVQLYPRAMFSHKQLFVSSKPDIWSERVPLFNYFIDQYLIFTKMIDVFLDDEARFRRQIVDFRVSRSKKIKLLEHRERMFAEKLCEQIYMEVKCIHNNMNIHGGEGHEWEERVSKKLNWIMQIPHFYEVIFTGHFPYSIQEKK